MSKEDISVEEKGTVLPAEKPAKTTQKQAKAKKILLQATHTLLEPIKQIPFPAGVPVEVDAVTGWMQSQIDAGLMIRLDT